MSEQGQGQAAPAAPAAPVSPEVAARVAEQAAQAAAAAAQKAAADANLAAARNAQGMTGDLSGKSYGELRQMLEELRNQRSDLASRRTNLADTYEAASGANRLGIESRLTILDNNIVMYEAEIARVGREMASKVGTRGFPQVPPGGQQPNSWGEDDVAGAVFGTFLTTLLLTIFIGKRYVRRRYGRMGAPSQPNMVQSNERLDRIEQAVDTIAVEIERVSENQRFMTRLMTETQLGDTLKDVRKSTELAKSAAAEG